MENHLSNVCEEAETIYDVWFRGDQEECREYNPDIRFKIENNNTLLLETNIGGPKQPQYVPIYCFCSNHPEDFPEKLRFLADTAEILIKELKVKVENEKVINGNNELGVSG